MKRQKFISHSIVFILLISSFSLVAQGDENSESYRKFTLGIGDLSGGYGGSTKLSYSYSPYAGYSVNKHLMLGAQFGFEEFNSFGGTPEISFLQEFENRKIGLFGRYTFTPENKFTFYVQSNVNMNFNRYQSTDLNEGWFRDWDKERHMSVDLNFGIKVGGTKRFNFLLDVGGINYNGNIGRIDFNLNRASIAPRVQFKF